MKCSNCGNEMASKDKFCSHCGAKVPDGKICRHCGRALKPNEKFCMNCGEPVSKGQICRFCGQALKPNVKFCFKCGKPVNAAPEAPKPGTVQMAPPRQAGQGKPFYKNKRFLLIAAVCCVVFVIILVSVMASNPGRHGVTGRLNTGGQTQVAEGSVGPAGGSITVDSGGESTLDGMTINVPGGAYDTSVDFTVSEAPIRSQTFGELFKPISPLISVDNGEMFASQPLEVTIPIQLEEGQFAMGFYYNEEEGTLEGIPLLEETDSSITLMTRHFSDIYIAMADEEKILGRALDGINTGFEPGKNDFIMPNYGSYLRPKGHCAGQSIAAMHYYLQADQGGQWSGQLYGRFDNNSGEKTPALWQDDANAVRLCSVIQEAAMVDWNTGADIAEYHKFKNQRNDEKTYYALAYAMMGTGSPQLVYCARSNADGAHMVLAYKIEDGVIYIADPNFPGDVSAERTIELDRSAAVANNAGPQLAPYYSAANAEEAQKAGEKPYDIIAYYGMYALLEEYIVDACWTDLLDGNDPWNLAIAGDLKFSAFTGLVETDTGETEKDLVPLSDGLTLYESRLADTAAAGGILFITSEIPVGLKNVTTGTNVYIGDKEVKWEKIPSMPGFYGIPLQPGENDVGIYFSGINPQYPAQGYRFINFYRFKIIYDDSGAAVTPEYTPEPSWEYSPEPTEEYTPEPSWEYSPEPTVEPTAEPSPEPTAEPTAEPSQEGTFDYAAALSAWAADYAAKCSEPYDDGYSNTTCVFEWVVAPYIQDGQVYGAHRIYYTNVYYAGPKAGTTVNSVTEMYDASNPGIYISAYELQEIYPQFLS